VHLLRHDDAAVYDNSLSEWPLTEPADGLETAPHRVEVATLVGEPVVETVAARRAGVLARHPVALERAEALTVSASRTPKRITRPPSRQ
jgi:hypothetical protein